MLPRMAELRLAWRTLRRAPNFAVFSVLALALAIAANTTMASLVDGLVFPEVDLPHPDRLVVAHFVAPRSPLFPNVTTRQVLGDSGRTYAHTAWWRGGPFQLPIRLEGRSVPVAIALLPGNTFVVAGARPLHGTLFVDSTAESARQAVITDRLWRRISQGRRAFAPFHLATPVGGVTVIGVVGARGALPINTDIYIAYNWSRRGGEVLIRMRPDVTREQLLTELNAQAPNIDPSHSPLAHFELRAATFTPVRRMGLVGALIAATLAVLLIACANIANLLLARGMARSRELATRMAFGASRLQLARLLFAESGIIAAAGGAAGIVLSLWTIPLVGAYLPQELVSTGLVQPQISWRVIAAGVGLSVGAALAFALAPAVLLLRRDLARVIREGVGTRHATAKRSSFQLLVVVEVAGALVLLVSASLMGSSLARLVRLNVGFNPNGLVLASVRDPKTATAPADAPPTREVIAWRYDERQRLAAVPGVTGVTATWRGSYYPLARIDDPAGGDERVNTGMATIRQVAPNYLRVLGIPVTRGRDFGESEDDRLPSVILDETAAHLFWPNADPVGRLVRFEPFSGSVNTPWMRVVGITRPFGFDPNCGGDPNCLRPNILIADGAAFHANASGTTYYVRGHGSADVLAEQVRRRLAVDAPSDSTEVQTYRDATGADDLARIQRFITALFGSFAVVGLLLALIGVYGVASYSVERRTREFGVRLALGARRADIVRLVLRNGNATALLGIAVGLLASNWVAVQLQQVLLGAGFDLVWFLAISVVLLFVATVGAGIPAALRAARVNPVDTLRAE